MGTNRRNDNFVNCFTPRLLLYRPISSLQDAYYCRPPNVPPHGPHDATGSQGRPGRPHRLPTIAQAQADSCRVDSPRCRRWLCHLCRWLLECPKIHGRQEPPTRQTGTWWPCRRSSLNVAGQMGSEDFILFADGKIFVHVNMGNSSLIETWLRAPHFVHFVHSCCS